MTLFKLAVREQDSGVCSWHSALETVEITGEEIASSYRVRGKRVRSDDGEAAVKDSIASVFSSDRHLIV